jgi:hypothetical protein
MTLKVFPPETAVGISFDAVEPSPSSPRSFRPQQYAAPLVVKPQV